MFSYCLLCFKKGFAESRASNERHRVTFQGGGLTFWSVCLPVVHPLSVAVVVVFNVCFVLISFKFKTLSDLFVEDSRGVVVPFDAFSPFGILCFFLLTFIVCVNVSCVCLCLCELYFLNATASHRTLVFWVCICIFCLFACLFYYTCVYVCYLFSGRSHFAIYLG